MNDSNPIPAQPAPAPAAPVAPAGPAPAQAPMPTEPAPAPAAPVVPGVAPAADGKKNNKGLLIGIICGVAALVVAIIVIVLVIVLNSNKVVGKYELDSIEGGADTSESDIASAMALMKAFGMSITMEFKDDGSCSMDMSAFGESESRKCTYDGSKVKFEKDDDSEAQDLSYTYADDKVTLEQDGAKMIFKRIEEK